MIRLPAFELLEPPTLDAALELLEQLGARGRIVAGGTDLYPNMKRRQEEPAALISLGKLADLHGIRVTAEGVEIGALTRLAEVASSSEVPPALAKAAALVASPQIRNAGTVGGNLCLDTRCNYLDMTEEWRDAAVPCMKIGGETCWVAPQGSKCVAVSSSDLAPVAVALDASVNLTGKGGERLVKLDDLYRDDGIAYLTKDRDEIMTKLVVPGDGRRATYHKLRRRGSIDFPILGVAAAISVGDDDLCGDARLVFGAVSPAPLRATKAEEYLAGKHLSPDVIAETARIASDPVRPFDNTDLGSRYRKWMAPVLMERVLAELA